MRQGIMLQRSDKHKTLARRISLAAVSFAIVGLGILPAAAQERVSQNRSSEGLYVEQGGPLRGDRVSLDERYKSFVYASKDAEGNVHVDCLDEHPHESSQAEASE